MEKFYLAAICAVVPGLGRSKVPQLINRFGSAEAVYKATEQQLKDVKICSEKQIINFISNRNVKLPQKLAEFCFKNNIDLISIYDDVYPESLKEIHDAPLVLYVKGHLPASGYNLAVVGSRAASCYGLKAAAYFASAFAGQNIAVISGGAKGIDAAAHEACIKAGGKTVAVLGCGIDVVYPAENRELFDKIALNGALVTEYPPGTGPLARNFPARNRIIVGLSRGVVVAEAARKSGAIITADIAADEARDVYCVPGNIFSGQSLGCHDLIRTGAKLVDSPGDIFEDIAEWYCCNKKAVQQNIFEVKQEPHSYAKEEKAENMNGLALKIIKMLEQEPLSLEAITEQSGVSLAEISMELLNLQMTGKVAVDNMQRYYRV